MSPTHTRAFHLVLFFFLLCAAGLVYINFKFSSSSSSSSSLETLLLLLSSSVGGYSHAQPGTEKKGLQLYSTVYTCVERLCIPNAISYRNWETECPGWRLARRNKSKSFVRSLFCRRFESHRREKGDDDDGQLFRQRLLQFSQHNIHAAHTQRKKKSIEFTSSVGRRLYYSLRAVRDTPQTV
jgi:hypothetical protein